MLFLHHQCVFEIDGDVFYFLNAPFDELDVADVDQQFCLLQKVVPQIQDFDIGLDHFFDLRVIQVYFSLIQEPFESLQPGVDEELDLVEQRHIFFVIFQVFFEKVDEHLGVLEDDLGVAVDFPEVNQVFQSDYEVLLRVVLLEHLRGVQEEIQVLEVVQLDCIFEQVNGLEELLVAFNERLKALQAQRVDSVLLGENVVEAVQMHLEVVVVGKVEGKKLKDNQDYGDDVGAVEEDEEDAALEVLFMAFLEYRPLVVHDESTSFQEKTEIVHFLVFDVGLNHLLMEGDFVLVEQNLNQLVPILALHSLDFCLEVALGTPNFLQLDAHLQIHVFSLKNEVVWTLRRNALWCFLAHVSHVPALIVDPEIVTDAETLEQKELCIGVLIGVIFHFHIAVLTERAV